jgi:hypothetical protein
MSSFFGIFKSPNRKKKPKSIPDVEPYRSPSYEALVGVQVRITRDDQNVNPIGMSYWRNINNHSGQDILKLFLAINDELTIFTFDKRSLRIVGERKLGIHHTGEGCYFSAIQSDMLYFTEDNYLYRVNIDTNVITPVMEVPATSILWQCHSSWDDKTHSGLQKDRIRDYEPVLWVVVQGHDRYVYPIKGSPDECQIDKSGEYLVIKEDNYNRIVHIPSREERIITDEEGAVGHSDCGDGTLIGEDDWFQGLVQWDLRTFEKKNLLHTGSNMGYVSVQGSRILLTSPENLILVDEHGGSRILCSNLSEDQSYENRPKANLCPLGEYAIWTAFVNGRRDAYLVRL